MKQALLGIDRFWCGSSLVGAGSLFALSTATQNPLKLAMLRFFSIIALFCELLGGFLLVQGAVSHEPKYFLLGAWIKACSYLASGVFHNQSGIYLQLWWSEHLETVRRYQKEFSGILNQLGLTDQEIQSIPSLPQELYSSELTSYPYSRLLNLSMPLVCSIVLIMQQLYLPALLIMGIGALSFPLGRYFFREFRFRQYHEQRLAISAKSYNNLSNSMQKHLRLSFRVNAISQLPLLLFSLMPFLGIERTLFANYLAFTMGLSGLIGLLAFQKSRVASQCAVKKANHLLTALLSDFFLLSEQQFQKHIQQQPPWSMPMVNIPFEEGVIIKEFLPQAFLSSTHPLNPLSVSIPKRGVHVLQAPSGSGKSVLILSLLHLIDHHGEIVFVKNRTAINLHTLSKEECFKAFVFFRNGDLLPSARLVDLFAKPLQSCLKDLYKQSEDQFGVLLNELAWNGEDLLLEEEIRLFAQGSQSLFPAAMIPILIQIRQEKENLFRSWLGDLFDDHFQIVPDRVFCTLSAGEQRRLVNLLTIKTALFSDQIKLVILDEPLANLDEKNIERQLQVFREFQGEKGTPLLLVTHHHAEQIEEELIGLHCTSIGV